MAECSHRNDQNHNKCNRSTDFPEVGLILFCVRNALHVHAKIGREE